MGSEISYITPNIWLSGYQALKQMPQDIDIVITAMTQEEVRDYRIEALVKDKLWHWFEADDSEDEEIYRHFFAVHDILREAEAAGKKVLVHCAGGISRSPTLVIAHMMQKHKWSRTEALEYVKKRREWVQPNDGFMTQLNLLERFLKA